VFPLPVHEEGGVKVSEVAQKLKTVDQVTVSSSVLADLFGLTDRRIRQLENEGVIKKIARGRYSLQENIKSYINFIKANADLKEKKTEENKVDYDEEHALLEQTKRKKLELELAAMRGTIHHREDVERVMMDMLANFKAKILSIPSKLAPNLMTFKSDADIQEYLLENMIEVLEELSEYNPKDFYNEKYVDIVEDEINEGVTSEEEKSETTDS